MHWTAYVMLLLEQARAVRVTVTDDTLSVDLEDGRTIAVPIVFYPRLAHGTEAERTNVQITGRGVGMHWPDLDEDISVKGLLVGGTSMESPSSFARWLENYAAGDVYRDVPTLPLPDWAKEELNEEGDDNATS
jgi:hypothetical protein